MHTFTASGPARRTSTLRAVRADQETAELDATSARALAEISNAVDAQLSATVTANTQAAKAVQVQSGGELRAKVQASIRKLSIGLLERETEVSAH